MAKKASTAQLDFTNVKDGGQFNKKHQTPGDYLGRITSVADAEKKDDKSVKMWLFTIEVGTGKYPYYCTRTAENQLWKIRNLFVAAGVNVPKKRVSVDPNNLVGKEIGVTLEDDEYDGKVNSAVASTFPVSELDPNAMADEGEEEAADEAPKKSKGEKPKKDKGDKKGKKSNKVKDSELEELDVADI